MTNKNEPGQEIYNDNFRKQVQENVYNEMCSRHQFGMQAMTFFARTDEELIKKVEEWLVYSYKKS